MKQNYKHYCPICGYELKEPTSEETQLEECTNDFCVYYHCIHSSVFDLYTYKGILNIYKFKSDRYKRLLKMVKNVDKKSKINETILITENIIDGITRNKDKWGNI